MTNPSVTLDILPATTLISVEPQKVLLVGQQTAAATAVSGELTENILNDSSEDTLFGKNSMLAGMARMFKRVNKLTQLDLIGLDDAAGTPATGTITFADTATENGTLVVNIGSRKNNSLNIDIVSGDTETVVAAALVAAITADLTNLTTAGNVAGVVTLTAVHDGLEGNTIGLEVVGSVAGITSSMTVMTGGLTNPTLTTLLDVVSDKLRYQTIAFPSTYDLTIFTDFLDARSNVTNNILDGSAYVSITDTFSALDTIGDGEDTLNLIVLGNQKVDKALYKGSAEFELDANIAALYAAVDSLRLTDGSNLSRLVTSVNGARDTTGGIHLASLPYFNTPLNDLSVIDQDVHWTQLEIDSLNDAGISVLENDQNNRKILMGEVVTTYKTNNAKQPDPTFKFQNIVRSSRNVREFIVNNIRAAYPQHRLTDAGQSIAQHNFTDSDQVAGFLTGLYQTLSEAGFVLTRSGEENLRFVKDNIVISTILVDGLIRIDMKTPLVAQAREFRGTVQIVFDTTQ
jgi:phage tail sheath gpL-like